MKVDFKFIVQNKRVVYILKTYGFVDGQLVVRAVEGVGHSRHGIHVGQHFSKTKTDRAH